MQCEMYRHNVTSMIIEKHHIVPLSWWQAAGKIPDTPFANLCPTCHMNTHAALDSLIRHDTVGAPLRAIRLAQKGIDLALAAGLTPRRTL